MDQIIEALEDHDGLPKIHRLAMLVTATIVAFAGSEVTKKVYIGTFHKLHSQ